MFNQTQSYILLNNIQFYNTAVLGIQMWNDKQIVIIKIIRGVHLSSLSHVSQPIEEISK